MVTTVFEGNQSKIFLQSLAVFSRICMTVISDLYTFLLVTLVYVQMLVTLVNTSGPWSGIQAVSKALPRQMWLLRWKTEVCLGRHKIVRTRHQHISYFITASGSSGSGSSDAFFWPLGNLHT